MRKTLKRLLCATLAVGMVLGGAACNKQPVEEKPEVTNTPVATQEPEPGAQLKTIGICQYADHSALNQSREGFLKGLEEAGLVEGTDYQIDYQNAGLDSAKCETIAKDFVSKKVDLICSIATNASTACLTAVDGKDIPLIYAAVTDPESAGLLNGNVTGTSDELRIDAQLKMIRELQPGASAIGIVYSTNEPNASFAIGEYGLLGMEHGFVIRTIGVSSPDEVKRAVDTLISLGVDCFSTVSDNGIATVLPTILEQVGQYGLPVYGCDKAQVEAGCVASAAIDYYELGLETGAMAAKVLKGEEEVSTMQPKTIYKYNLYINTKAISSTSLFVSDKIVKTAIDVSAEQ